MAAPPCRPAGRAELPAVLHRLRDLAARLVDVDGGDRLGGAGQRGGATGLGYVFSAGVVSQVLMLAFAGAIADRLGRRRVMLRPTCCAARRRPAWRGTVRRAPRDLAVRRAGLAKGTGEAFFSPALSALTWRSRRRSS